MNPRANRGIGANFAKIREQWPFKPRPKSTKSKCKTTIARTTSKT